MTVTALPGRPGSAPDAEDGFDELASSYDETFSRSVLGRRFREAVWAHLDGAFGPGDRVLDLGCGTGEDALHLARRGVRVFGIDASPTMVRRARRKASRAGLDGRVIVARAAIEELPSLALEAAPFDGVVSNFGALNCVEDLEAVARTLAERTRPGARVFLCVMGRFVPWEWVWYLLRGRPGDAFRRLRPGGATWRGVRVRYPTPGGVARAFSDHFEARRPVAVGALLPPTYAETWALRHPRLIGILARAERRAEKVPPLPHLADHFLVELSRR